MDLILVPLSYTTGLAHDPDVLRTDQLEST